MMRFLFGRSLVIPIFILPLALPLSGQGLRDPQFVSAARKGFDAIYNIEYDEAVRRFKALEGEYPQHPGPPLYVAMSIWLEELFHRQELGLDKFAGISYFTRESDQVMLPEQRQAFFNAIQRGGNLAKAILEKDAGNEDALYFLGNYYGILASFRITIDHSVRGAFSEGKRAYEYHRELVEKNPQYYDAYLSVGLYQYIVGSLPWYLRWMAGLIGYHGSKEEGLKDIALAAEKGLFVTEDARAVEMLLDVVEKRHDEALQHVRVFQRKYPRNFLFALNEAQILENMGRRKEALERYHTVLQRAESQQPNYQKLPLKTFRYAAAAKLMELGDLDGALEQFQKSIANTETPEREKALSYLRSGQILDLLDKRQDAIRDYQQVLEMREFEDSRREARKYLKKPYREKG